jgi:hypothetical protein
MPHVDASGLATSILVAAKDHNVVIGPPIWHPNDGAYFVVARGKRGQSFKVDQVKGGQGVDLCQIREALIAALMVRPPVRVFDIDDESQTISRCEELWPCEQVAAVRRAFEMEKAAIRAAMRPN